MGHRQGDERPLEDADSRYRPASPIVWGNKVFVVGALSSAGDMPPSALACTAT